MKKTFCFALLMGTAMNMAAQTSDLFIPHRHTDLRLPSVPLVVSDPYFSIWSPYNTLNEGCTRNWTDAENLSKESCVSTVRTTGFSVSATL